MISQICGYCFHIPSLKYLNAVIRDIYSFCYKYSQPIFKHYI